MKRGWAKPFRTQKYHYIVNAGSVCGKFTHWGEVSDDIEIKRETCCRHCMIKFRKLNQYQTVLSEQ